MKGNKSFRLSYEITVEVKYSFRLPYVRRRRKTYILEYLVVTEKC